MDGIVADAWSLLGVIWRAFLVVALLVVIAWIIVKGRQINSRTFENGKLDAETRADSIVDMSGRNTPPPF